MTTWLDAERRQRIQVFAGTLVPLLIIAGLTTETAAEQWLIILGAVLQFGAAALSLVNLKGNWQEAWTVARGALYALAATVAPALTVLGLINEQMSATILTGLSLALTALTSLLAIFVSGEQQRADVVQGEVLEA